MKNGNFISSFNYAVQGIISTLRTERNMKFHYITALAVIILSLFFDLSRTEFMQMIFAITFVVCAEMFNTAIERTVDLVVQDYNPIAKYIKDVAAGAVLLAAINALVTGYLIFYDRIIPFGDLLIRKIKNSNSHLSFVAILVVLILTVGGKYIRAKKKWWNLFSGRGSLWTFFTCILLCDYYYTYFGKYTCYAFKFYYSFSCCRESC